MKQIDQLVDKIDGFQRAHRWAGLTYATIKQSGDDSLGYQIGLLTYYGFLSLFPLLIVATSVLQVIFKGNSALKSHLLNAIGQYFPAMNSELQTHVHSLHKSGPALIIAIVVTLYGARGAASALQNVFDHMWRVPRYKRPGFPKNILDSLAITVIGGGGLVLAAAVSSLATSLGHGLVFRLLAILVSIVLIFLTLFVVFGIATNAPRSRKARLFNAFVSSLALQILQTLGTYIMTHELKNLSLLYGTFALVLGLMFWLYLQIEVVLWVTNFSVVRSYRLWPRSINQKNPTEADKKAYELIEQRELLTETKSQ